MLANPRPMLTPRARDSCVPCVRMQLCRQLFPNLFDPLFVGRGGWAHSIVRPWVPIAPHLYIALSVAVYEFFIAGSKRVSARPTRKR